mgnify:CR=1 FL=1
MKNIQKTPFPFYHKKVAVENSGRPISTLTDEPVTLLNLDIQVQTNAVDFGDRNGQDLQLSVGDIYSNPLNKPIKMQDIWVSNHSSGDTGYIVITGLLVV